MAPKVGGSNPPSAESFWLNLDQDSDSREVFAPILLFDADEFIEGKLGSLAPMAEDLLYDLVDREVQNGLKG